MANVFGSIRVKITWEYIQVWRSLKTDLYRLPDGIEPVGFRIKDLEACRIALEMLNFMGAMGWENYFIIEKGEEGRHNNYFFKRAVIQETGPALQVNNTGAESVSKDFDIMKRLMGGD